MCARSDAFSSTSPFYFFIPFAPVVTSYLSQGVHFVCLVSEASDPDGYWWLLRLEYFGTTSSFPGVNLQKSSRQVSSPPTPRASFFAYPCACIRHKLGPLWPSLSFGKSHRHSWPELQGRAQVPLEIITPTHEQQEQAHLLLCRACCWINLANLIISDCCSCQWLLCNHG